MAAFKNIPFAEKRVIPRCTIDTDVKVQINSRGSDLEFAVRSINISIQTIELACDDSLIQAILAQNAYPHECEIEFSVTCHTKPFSLKTHVVTHRRLSQHEYQLVLRFVDVRKNVQERLLHELVSLRVMDMEPKTQENVSLAV